MINCVITSPKETISYKDLQSVALPALTGQMQILSGHAESFVLLKKGSIVLEKSGQQNKLIQITNGECYIKDDVVTIVF